MVGNELKDNGGGYPWPPHGFSPSFSGRSFKQLT